jgi:signal peptidase complex subunit 2
MPFPQSRPLLGICCFSYALLSAILQYIVSFIDKDTILLTKSRNGQPEELRIRASFPKYQEYYTLIIQYKEDTSKATTGKMYVGKYFTSRGEFDEVGFSLDVQKHLQRFGQGKFGDFEYNHKIE